MQEYVDPRFDLGRATGPGGVDPWTLRVKGTRDIHVVDASLHPAPLSAHPMATIMAVAEKASDILRRLL
jgi:choline dehydrogenase